MLSRVTKTTSRGGQEPHKSLNPFHAGHEDQLCDTDSSSRVPSMSESSDSSFSFSASASPLSARSNLPSLRRTQKDVAALPVQRRPTPSTTARQRAPSDSQLNSDVNAIPDLRQGVDATASETNTRLSVGQALGAAIADAVDLPAPPRLSANGLQLDLRPRDSSHTISSISTLQPASLRSVRDLGVDYTRYFVPQRASTQSPGETSRLLQGYDTDGARGTDDWSHVPCAASSDDEASMHGRTKSGPASLSACKAMGAGHGDTGVKRTSSTPSMQCMSTLSNVPRDASATPAGRDAHFFPYLDDRFGAPDTAGSGYNFPMYWDEKEADDDMHTPMSDDDTRLKPKFRDHFTRDNICSTIGLVSMVLGLLILFVMLPILSAIDIDGDGYSYKTEDNGPGSARPWDWVNDETHALMKHIRSGLIDEDTPYSALTREAYDGSTLKLVFSDEFNDGHRTFYAGDDPFFRGFDGWYGSTQDLEWYDPDAVTTYNGSLELRLDAFPNRGLQYRSGMLQSWNQLCFKGSVFEVSVSLPGPAGVQGLWPGVWTMGNLGRPGYLATTEGTWPYTYSACDAGITPNQSMSDGTSKLPGQKLTSCGCRGSDHPTPGTGRGAPEIDIIEALASWGVGDSSRAALRCLTRHRAQVSRLRRSHIRWLHSTSGTILIMTFSRHQTIQFRLSTPILVAHTSKRYRRRQC